MELPRKQRLNDTSVSELDLHGAMCKLCRCVNEFEFRIARSDVAILPLCVAVVTPSQNQFGSFVFS